MSLHNGTSSQRREKIRAPPSPLKDKDCFALLAMTTPHSYRGERLALVTLTHREGNDNPGGKGQNGDRMDCCRHAEPVCNKTGKQGSDRVAEIAPEPIHTHCSRTPLGEVRRR